MLKFLRMGKIGKTTSSNEVKLGNSRPNQKKQSKAKKKLGKTR